MRSIVGRVAFIGLSDGDPILLWSTQANQPLDIFATVQALALDALTKTAQETATDVGIERRRLDA